MVIASVVYRFIAGDAVIEGYLAGQPAFRQHLQRAIYGGETNGVVLLLDQPIEFVGREVIASIQKGAEDDVALGSLLQSNASQMVLKDGLGLAHVFARDRRMIIH